MTVLDYQTESIKKRYLVYSKSIKDRLPITITAVDAHPCLNPAQTSSRSGFYPTELDRGDVCYDDEFDLRYNLVGFSISEFDLWK